MVTRAFRAGLVFDGWRLHDGAAVSLTPEGRVAALHAPGTVLPRDAHVTDLGPGILAPGFVDLQVNGGGGEMIGTGTDAEQLARICAVHAALGATAILPTLITDRREITGAAIAAGLEAHRRGVPGFAGLHLEGPHLDPARKGAHDAALIRPMTSEDLGQLCEAARALPALMITLAPEAATPEQIGVLSRAGAVVSLGHSGCSAEAARKAQQAGARCVTHLFNAMGPLRNRDPGLLGAALTGPLSAGVIADGIHVAAECLEIALRMKAPDGLFLVSDAMATAGSGDMEFRLNGRRILRRDGRLTLEDGTLAGADITLAESVAHLVSLGTEPARALAMASRIPAQLIGDESRGRFTQGARGDMILLSPRYELGRVWRMGQPLAPSL